MAVNQIFERLQHLRPSLPKQVDWQRRDYHNEPWYLLHDHTSGQFHRFNPTAYQILAQMDGRTSLSELLENTNYLLASEGEPPVSDSDLLELVQYLHVADLLICDMPASTKELFQRRSQKKHQGLKQWLINPVAWKVRLFNPDTLLEKLTPLAHMLTRPLAGFIWLAVVGYALLQAGNYTNTLSLINIGTWLTPANLFWLWLTYPLLKVVHELGHGLAVKAFGGQIREMGIVFIFATPMPYVDASAATGFSEKWQRILVSAAGILVELFLASVAFLLWLTIEDSLLKTLLLNIAILGSISTLFFNGNPLLRFDGYHILCDWLDQANLASRANRQISYLSRRFGYGIKTAKNPARNIQESIGLSVYAIGAFAYRLIILVTLILLASQYLPLLGALLAIWLGASQILWPAVKHVHFLSTDQTLSGNRSRAGIFTSSLFVVLLLLVVFIPLPHNTRAEGIIWLPENAKIKAQFDGFIDQIHVQPGDKVTTGTLLFSLSNAELEAELKKTQGLLKEYQARYDLAFKDDRAEAGLFRQDITAIEEELELLAERQASLKVTAKSDGIWLDQDRHWHLGQFLAKGSDMGLVVPDKADKIRIVIEQHEVGSTLQGSSDIELRLASSPRDTYQAELLVSSITSTYQLPSPLLGSRGGGRIAVDQDPTVSLRPIFVLDLLVKDQSAQGRFGERAHIKIHHEPATLSARINRWLQQTFIKTLEP